MEKNGVLARSRLRNKLKEKWLRFLYKGEGLIVAT